MSYIGIDRVRRVFASDATSSTVQTFMVSCRASPFPQYLLFPSAIHDSALCCA